MVISCRPIEEADRRAAVVLSHVSFGSPPPREDEPLPPEREQCTDWGCFDGTRLVAMARDRHVEQWFGGRLVPSCGVASVSVGAEDRGGGYAQVVLQALLAGARERGAVISTLYPTAPSLYRRMGWEQAGILTWMNLPTRAFAGLRRPEGVSLRRATSEDAGAIRALYAGAGAAASGWLARTGDPLEGISGATLAVDAAGSVVGCTRWDRGHGYHEDSTITVHDLIGRDGPATAALVSSLGSWASVAPTLSLQLPYPDPVNWLLPYGVGKQGRTEPWMIRLVDAPAAVAARGWPAALEVSLELELTDEVCAWNAGRFVLTVSGGAGSLTPGGSGRVHLGPRGLALAYAGGVTADLLRRAGLIGCDDADVPVLDAVMAGPAPAMLDYF